MDRERMVGLSEYIKEKEIRKKIVEEKIDMRMKDCTW